MRACIALLCALLATPGVAAAPPTTGETTTGADDFLMVHCLLPGQLRQLGRNSTYLSPRRPKRLSAAECATQGGEFVRAEQLSSASTLPLWLPLAKDGNSDAQLLVGELLEQQRTPDYGEAMRWYERAAEQGNSAAMLHLSRFAEVGLALPAPDPSAARYWMRRALTIDQSEPPTPVADGIGAAHQTPEINWQPQQTAALILSERTVARLTEELASARQATEQQSNGQATTIENLEAQLQQANKTLAELQARIAERALIGPTISLIDPSKVRTRSADTLVLDMPAGELELIGRIDAPAGLLSARLDQQPVVVNTAGIFLTRISAAAEPRSATITAVDQQGKRDTLTLQLVPPQPVAAASATSPMNQRAPAPDPLRSIDYGQFHALVIGNNRYRHLPQLTTAVNDANAISQVLRERFGFTVTQLTNADRYSILSALNTLRETLTSADNLLIYYAGHGELDQVNQRGHWLPVDAEATNSANWISNTSVSDLVNAINARHVFMVVDSCYAGTLTRSGVSNLHAGMTSAEQLQWTRQRVAKRARLVLASGGVAPVLDEGSNGHSVFAGALLDALRQTTAITASRDLYQAVAARVTHAAADYAFDQLPEYAPLRFAGHEAGEFFLVPTENALAASQP